MWCCYWCCVTYRGQSQCTGKLFTGLWWQHLILGLLFAYICALVNFLVHSCLLVIVVCRLWHCDFCWITSVVSLFTCHARYQLLLLSVILYEVSYNMVTWYCYELHQIFALVTHLGALLTCFLLCAMWQTEDYNSKFLLTLRRQSSIPRRWLHNIVISEPCVR